MSSLSDAAEFAQRWAENQRGMVAVADALKNLGSMEQATSERKAALDAATKAHEDKKKEVADVEAKLAAANAQHEAALSAHDAELMTRSENATASAATIIEDARSKARTMIAEAEAEVARVQADHANTLAGMKAELDAHREALIEAQQAKTETEQAHHTLAERIEAMRETARGLLG